MTTIDPNNPLLPFLRQQGAVALDGGLATTMELRGFDLNDPLWSARAILDDPTTVGAVHAEFLAAGADCIATATYQASLPGLAARGLTPTDSTEVLEKGARLAVEARDEFWSRAENRAGRERPLVVGSVGPYGAYLADGSEYVGDYRIDQDALREFHEWRWRVLAGSAVDLLACETIPNGSEAGVLLDLLAETPDRWAWISFSCKDGRHLSDGTPLREVVARCDGAARIAAVGFNCVAPGLVPELLAEARPVTAKPILVYPNAGGDYDAERKVWPTPEAELNWGRTAPIWVAAGAAGVGGCCRVPPESIRAIRDALIDSS